MILLSNIEDIKDFIVNFSKNLLKIGNCASIRFSEGRTKKLSKNNFARSINSKIRFSLLNEKKERTRKGGLLYDVSTFVPLPSEIESLEKRRHRQRKPQGDPSMKN